MRYDDWDILLFPSSRDSGQDSKVPMKEFKVGCQVVPDIEVSHGHGSLGLPVMTCFIPSLQAGTPFHISVHSWRTPEISQYTKNFSKHTDLVKFEARILIDGRVVASTAFDRQGSWPYLITSTFEFTKSGELEPFRFPHFRRELLYHNHWHAGDDIGRIKIVISEGFPRDSLSNPIERVKNIVAFSFQHAPLDILEANGIAWPNPQMWRRAPLMESLPVPAYRSEDGADSHGHSPRRQSFILGGKGASHAASASLLGGVGSITTSQSQPQGLSQGHSQGLMTNPMLGQSLGLLAQGNGLTTGGVTSFPDPVNDTAAYIDWCSNMSKNAWNPDIKAIWGYNPRAMSKQSSTDTSMPDYTSSNGAQNFVDPLQMPTAMMMDDEFNVTNLKVPTNTPTAAPSESGSNNASFSFSLPNSAIPADLATSLTHSLLNQPHPLPVQPHMIPLPASEIKSRKENRHLTLAANAGAAGAARNGSPANPSPCASHVEKRNFSQPNFGIIGAGLSTGPTNPMTTAAAHAAATVAAANAAAKAAAAAGAGPSLATAGASTTTTTTNNSSRVPSRSPSDGPIFSAQASRAPSAGEFGTNITNLADPPAPSAPVASGAGAAGAAPAVGSAEKGVKRARNFTPASTKAIDEEDEPRRVSPRLRTGNTFAGEERVEV